MRLCILSDVAREVEVEMGVSFAEALAIVASENSLAEIPSLPVVVREDGSVERRSPQPEELDANRLIRWILKATTVQAATMRHRSSVYRMGLVWRPTFDRALNEALFSLRDSRIVVGRSR